MTGPQGLMYADRSERYLRQRGIAYDPERMSIDRLTSRQRRRAIKKESQLIKRLHRLLAVAPEATQ